MCKIKLKIKKNKFESKKKIFKDFKYQGEKELEIPLLIVTVKCQLVKVFLLLLI
jgi:hypothetical protein